MSKERKDEGLYHDWKQEKKGGQGHKFENDWVKLAPKFANVRDEE